MRLKIKDGQYVEFKPDDKARPDLLSPLVQQNMAEFAALTTKKHPERNWEHSTKVMQHLAALERHLTKFKNNEHDEDHLTAVNYRAMMAGHIYELTKRGVLPPEFDDRPVYEKACPPESKLSQRVSAYLSHPIRGQKGMDATQQEIDCNNQKAIKVAEKLRHEFPQLDLYVPAEHDEVLGNLQRVGKLGLEDLLDADCEVLSKRDFVIVWGFDKDLVGGVKVEVEHARKLGIPVVRLLPALSTPGVKEIAHMVHYLAGKKGQSNV